MKENYYVWQVAERNGLLRIECRACHHSIEAYAKYLLKHLQEKALCDLKFKCSQCSSFDISVSLG